MSKWFDNVDNRDSNIIYSRIRLARNWDEYVFPSRITTQQCREMLERMKEGLKSLPELDGNPYKYRQPNEVRESEELAFGEHRILNLVAVNKEEPAGLLLSKGEDSSLVSGRDDHICMQFLAFGLKLDEL